MFNVKLIPDKDIEVILPFLKLLDANIADNVLEQRLQDMKQSNYLCAGVYDGDKLIGISGLWILNKYYVGKHIEPDNVIIHPDYRNKGAGDILMNWIHDFAREQGCNASELNCYISNQKAVAFWYRQGYRMLGFHMRKDLI